MCRYGLDHWEDSAQAVEAHSPANEDDQDDNSLRYIAHII